MHYLQGAQEIFNELPCEYVEPHELKEVSQNGGKEVGGESDLRIFVFNSLCITIFYHHKPISLVTHFTNFFLLCKT